MIDFWSGLKTGQARCPPLKVDTENDESLAELASGLQPYDDEPRDSNLISGLWAETPDSHLKCKPLSRNEQRGARIAGLVEQYRLDTFLFAVLTN
jgi:hypothetical protein